MEAEIHDRLTGEGVDDDRIRIDHSVKMRYTGQWRSLEVPCSHPIDDMADIRAGFHRQHQQTYAYSDEDQQVEIYGLHVTGSGLVEKPAFPEIETGDADDAIRGTREAYFVEAGDYVDATIYDRDRLGAGATFDGPAIVEQMDSTVVVPPNASAEVDATGNIIITV